ncbi:MAG TPA: CHAT domain-containing tetratricopeptide repeat protein [Candidatus Sulfopaludibacter sp.]|jgi:CHAT domain-containing protein/tetratricopeptide (TPR) repeat protein|nr:CHAT domain-containing tetratricopeptide repeat protein [Candidatus Sulfopaludibacter sp.]
METNTAIFSLAGLGGLRISVASSWTGQLESAEPNVPHTLTFRETTEGPARLLISIIPLPKDAPPPTQRDLWNLLLQGFEQLRSQVLENQPRPRGIVASGGAGCFFTITSRIVKPEEFLYMTSGMVPVGGLLLSFTILTNRDEVMLFTQALAAIRSATLEAAPPPAAAEDPLSSFLQLELNSDAALFAGDNPELQEDVSLLVLQKLAGSAERPDLRRRAAAALCSLLLARASGFTSAIWAPGEIASLPEPVFAALETASSQDTRVAVEALEALLQQAGAASTSRVCALAHLWLAALGKPDEAAVRHLETARNACSEPGDAFVRAAAALQLSTLYANRSTGDPADNFEVVINYARSALDVLDATRFLSDQVTAKIRLGIGYTNRVRGFRADNLELAIQSFESGLPLCTDSASRNWASLRINLGRVYLLRMVGAKQANATKSAGYLEEAVAARDASSSVWGTLQMNLGSAYQTLARFDIESTEKAIGHFEVAAAAFEGVDPVKWARAQHNLGIAYRDRELGKREENTAAAIDHLQKALTILTPSLPRDHRASQIALAGIYLATRQWELATAAYQSAIAADRVLISLARTLAGSLHEFSAIGPAYSDAAYCLLRLGRFEEAFLTLEKGKARLLSEPGLLSKPPEVQSLELKMTLLDVLDAQADKLNEEQRNLAQATRDELPGLLERVHPMESQSEPSVEALLAVIPAGGALAAPIVTKAGTAVFVLKSGASQITSEDILWIDTFAEKDLNRMLASWLPAYFQHKQERANWSRVIVNSGATLWGSVFAPIHERLTALALPPQAPLLLLPSAGLSLLPVHAAWRNSEGRRRYAAEDYTFITCPSLSLLARRAAMPAADAPESNLIAADPTGDLPFAAMEGKAVAAECQPEPTDLLLGDAASWSAVSSGFEKRTLLHFACHGVYDLTYPERSFLALAPPREVAGSTGNLRLLELFSAWDTRAARLVVLSGCETAITDILDAPGEYLGLATGWLRAGVLGVIGSLWVVDDLSTMLLMRFFYQGLKTLTAAAALRAAQLSLKDLSNQAVCEQLDGLARLSGLSPMELDWIAARRADFASEDPTAQPFQDPYWWAGFTYAGAG